MSATIEGRFPANTCPECGSSTPMELDLSVGTCGYAAASCQDSAEEWVWITGGLYPSAPAKGYGPRPYRCSSEDCAVRCHHTYYGADPIPALSDDMTTDPA